jgi:hypothetical protein
VIWGRFTFSAAIHFSAKWPLRIELRKMTQEVYMFRQDSVKRLGDKSPLHAIQMELQHS